MRLNKQKGFTLIELLVVMAIILILTGLVLAVISYVNKKTARTRAENEIKALSAALENYKADNGTYPNDGPILTGTLSSYTRGVTDTLNAQSNTYGDPTNAAYTNAGLVLYRALSGDTNTDRSLNATDEGYNILGSGTTSLPTIPTEYYHFTASQVLTTGTGASTKVTGITDPFGYSYGYSTAYQGDVAANLASNSTAAPTHGFNPTFDLWSTSATIISGSDSTTTANSKRMQWITNWQTAGASSGQ